MLCDGVVVGAVSLSGAGWCVVAAVVEVSILGAGPGRYSGFRRMETAKDVTATSVTASVCPSVLATGTVLLR